MNATKRKFNALLQGLGTSRPRTADEAATDLVSDSPSRSATKLSALDNEILKKRRRLGLPESTAPKLGNAIFTSATVTRKQQPDAKPKKVEPAKYSPSDRDELLRRLATFQEITDWTPKPDKVNEVEWAKRGWVCKGKETVRCLLCHKELLVKLNRKVVDGKEVSVLVASEIEDALVDKYAELIVDSHREDCLWRKRGCDDSILRLSLTHAKSSLQSLRQRYDELCARKAFLPYEFNLRLPNDLDLNQVLGQLPPNFFTAPPFQGMEDQPPNKVALILALLGWQGLSNSRIGAVPNSASCHTCLRRLGLWMFKSKEVADNGEVLVPAPMEFLDPVREHRFFCPWANGAAQSRGGAQSRLESEAPGWKILVQTLTNDSHLRSVYEGRPRSKTQPGSDVAPSTPQRNRQGVTTPVVTPQTARSNAGTLIDTPGTVASAYDDAEVDEKERDAKDKERWARLRRVKSLFDSKGSRRLKRSMSRPGTGHSTKSIGN